jgi:D-amino peptidase
VDVLKAFISVDLEGLPGVASLTMVSPWSSQFSIASKVMTRLVNATVDELFKNGFTEVLVADSHGYMTNINYLELDSRAGLIQGYPRPFSMLSGLDKSFNAVFFIGYHAAAGTIHGMLDHTYSGRVFAEIRVNGVRASEFLINTLYASEQGVPAALLAGDEYLGSEVAAHTPWVVFIPLKKGISRYAAYYPSIDSVESRLRIGVREACSRVSKGDLRLLEISKPYIVELSFRESLIADALEALDLFERIDAYRVRFKADSARKLLGVVEIAAYVGSSIINIAGNIK